MFIFTIFLNCQLKEFYFNYIKSDENYWWDKTNNQISIILVLLIIWKFLFK